MDNGNSSAGFTRLGRDSGRLEMETRSDLDTSLVEPHGKGGFMDRIARNRTLVAASVLCSAVAMLMCLICCILVAVSLHKTSHNKEQINKLEHDILTLNIKLKKFQEGDNHANVDKLNLRMTTLSEQIDSIQEDLEFWTQNLTEHEREAREAMEGLSTEILRYFGSGGAPVFPPIPSLPSMPSIPSIPTIPDTTEPVGFTAYGANVHDYSNGETVILDRTLSNLGGHYNTISGNFECPYHGVYLFSVNILSGASAKIIVVLRREGENLINTWADTLTGGYSQASNSLVVECKVGQRVSLRSVGDGTAFHFYSTFTGYMLYRYD